MFSFVGDTVLDPFNGTATTQVAAAACGRNSIGIEVDSVYFADGLDRLRRESGGLLSTADVSAREVTAANDLPSFSQPLDRFFDTLVEQIAVRNPNAVQGS